MKNVTLISFEDNGKQSFRLLGPDSTPIIAFDYYANALLKNKENTRRIFCRWLARFFDYMIESAQYIPGGILTRESLVDILEAYDDYLVLGEDSGFEIARNIAITLPSPRLSNQSSSYEHAALRKFLKLSERMRRESETIAKLYGNSTVELDSMQLLPNLGAKKQINSYQKKAMYANSMIAGCVRGGPSLIDDCQLPTSSFVSNYDEDKAFPWDKAVAFIDSFKTYRDKALYAGLAACGGRISELLQILWDDIDFKKRKLSLVDPIKRPNNASYLSRSPLERDRLRYKTRQHSLTLLIDPYASMFFKYLELYQNEEYIPHGRNQFVFQYNYKYKGEEEVGKPYFLAAYRSILDVFKANLQRVDIEDISGLGPHSFRHMYGEYCRNYYPRLDGSYGLEYEVLARLMGHKQVSSTKKYGKEDEDIRDIELYHANQEVFVGDRTNTINELRLSVLESKLEKVLKALDDEKREIFSLENKHDGGIEWMK